MKFSTELQKRTGDDRKAHENKRNNITNNNRDTKESKTDQKEANTVCCFSAKKGQKISTGSMAGDFIVF